MVLVPSPEEAAKQARFLAATRRELIADRRRSDWARSGVKTYGVEYVDKEAPAPPPDSPELTAIKMAVGKGDVQQLDRALHDISDPYSENQYIALELALSQDQLVVIDYLLKQGAAIRASSLRCATKNSLQWLVSSGWLDVNANLGAGDSPLLATLDKPELMIWLLEHGADPNLGPENINHRQEPFTDDNGRVLNLAAMQCPKDLFDKLLEHGAILEDSCALHHAALGSGGEGFFDTTLMEHLLELGVDINGSDESVSLQQPGRIGPPIFWAIRAGNLTKVKFLVEHGADLASGRGTGWDPINAIEALGSGAGSTPLQEVERTGWTEGKEYLRAVTLQHDSLSRSCNE